MHAHPHDVELENHGSIWIIQPLTPAGNAWADAHLPTDAIRWGGGIVAEPRYVPDIVDAMQADGLTVAGGGEESEA